MARTYRKKKNHWEFSKWYNYDLVEAKSKYGGTYYIKNYFEHNSKEYNKQLRKFHSEKYKHGVPSWFNRIFFQKPLRQKSRIMLLKWNGEDVIFPQFIHDSGWYYF